MKAAIEARKAKADERAAAIERGEIKVEDVRAVKEAELARKAKEEAEKAKELEGARLNDALIERQKRAREERRQARREFGRSVQDTPAAPEPVQELKPDGFGDSVAAARNAALAASRRPSGTVAGTTNARYGRPRMGRTVMVRSRAPFLALPA